MDTNERVRSGPVGLDGKVQSARKFGCNLFDRFLLLKDNKDSFAVLCSSARMKLVVVEDCHGVFCTRLYSTCKGCFKSLKVYELIF